VGVYLPISTSATMMAGGVLRWLVDRRLSPEEREGPDADSGPGVLFSSGLIAGGAITGVVLAALQAKGLDAAIDLTKTVGSQSQVVARVPRRAAAYIVIHSHPTPLDDIEVVMRVRIFAFAQLFALSSLAVGVGSPARAAAQKPRLGAISGTVKDSLGNLLPNVEVTAVKTEKVVRTDSAGAFVLSQLPSGPTDVTFRRLSFSPVVLNIQVPPEDTTEVEVTLGVVAQRLTGVVVQAQPDHLRELYAFETRRKQGIGHFITRGQIEDRNPSLLSDMVRMVPGVSLIAADNGRTGMRFARVARPNCPPQFYVDGIQVMGFSIDDMPPRDVEGVELYAGPAGLPPEYNRVYSNVICGSVLIWTRIPGSDRKPDGDKKPGADPKGDTL
jgi:hypothetical protein